MPCLASSYGETCKIGWVVDDTRIGSRFVLRLFNEIDRLQVAGKHCVQPLRLNLEKDTRPQTRSLPPTKVRHETSGDGLDPREKDTKPIILDNG